jgi:hypothetical protein
MADQDRVPQGLEPGVFTGQRDDAIREGVKGLLLINGGGATAMLAFLQAIWATKPQIAKYVVLCIACLAFGLFLAGLVHLFRYQASFAFQSGMDRRWRYRFLYLAAAYGSLGAFLVGIAIVVVGVLRNLS